LAEQHDEKKKEQDESADKLKQGVFFAEKKMVQNRIGNEARCDGRHARVNEERFIGNERKKQKEASGRQSRPAHQHEPVSMYEHFLNHPS